MGASDSHLVGAMGDESLPLVVRRLLLSKHDVPIRGHPNSASFAAAARAGNPNAILAFNPGVVYRMISLTPEEDFTVGEIDNPELVTIRRAVGGKVDGAQHHMLSFLGEKWAEALRGSPHHRSSSTRREFAMPEEP